MKKLLLALAFVACLIVPAIADDVPVVAGDVPVVDVYWSPLGINLITPLKYDSIISIYDFEAGEGLLGATTKLAEWKNIVLNFGGVTGNLFAGSPFLNLTYDFGTLDLTGLLIPLSHVGFVVGCKTDKSYLIGVSGSTSFALWE